MSVPREVRSAAVRALEVGRPEGVLLDVVEDSFLDHTDGPVGTDVRTLVFGLVDPVVRVQVNYSSRVAKELVVAVEPPRHIEVEVRAPLPELHQVVSGPSPVRLTTIRQGPATLVLTERSPSGRTRVFRTTWVTF